MVDATVSHHRQPSAISHQPSAIDMITKRSSLLFQRAQKILPGGVDSPVRAFKSVGASPLFIRRASGARIEDVDGNRYIDYVMSWGPLIHGHAPRGLVKALARGRAGRHQLRRAEPARGRARRARPRADAVARARALRQLRHRSGDERGARRARRDRTRSDPQVRRLLSRPRGRVPGEGRLRRADARDADQPRRDARHVGRHAGRRLQRSRVGAAGRSTRIAIRSPRSSSSRSPATWASCRRPTDSWPGCARSRAERRRAADLRRGDLGISRRAPAARRRWPACART